MSRHIRLCLWSETLSPMTHNSGTEGNVGLCATEPVDTPAGKRWVPFLSGNALRHRLVREPGALWLIDRLGLKGVLSQMAVNGLLHGGNLTGSTGREDVARIAALQRLFPLLRLVGLSLPNQIVAGSLKAWHGLLACEENRPYLAANLPDGWAAELSRPLKPAAHYVEEVQYTRGDGSRRTDLYDPESYDPDEKSNLMIVSSQCVIRGAAYSHGFEIPHGSDLELGALLLSLREWQAANATVGGMSGKGHGRLRTAVLAAEPLDVAALIAGYEAHVEAHRQACADWIMATWPAKREKPPADEKPKKGKGKAKPAETEEPADG